jgi:hypothetical protein
MVKDGGAIPAPHRFGFVSQNRRGGEIGWFGKFSVAAATAAAQADWVRFAETPVPPFPRKKVGFVCARRLGSCHNAVGFVLQKWTPRAAAAFSSA